MNALDTTHAPAPAESAPSGPTASETAAESTAAPLISRRVARWSNVPARRVFVISRRLVVLALARGFVHQPPIDLLDEIVE